MNMIYVNFHRFVHLDVNKNHQWHLSTCTSTLLLCVTQNPSSAFTSIRPSSLIPKFWRINTYDLFIYILLKQYQRRDQILNLFTYFVNDFDFFEIKIALFSSPDPKGQVSYCHHFSSVVCLSTFHILIFSSETTGPIATKLWWNGSLVAPFQNCVRWSRLPTKMATKLKIEKRGDEI